MGLDEHIGQLLRAWRETAGISIEEMTQYLAVNGYGDTVTVEGQRAPAPLVVQSWATLCRQQAADQTSKIRRPWARRQQLWHGPRDVELTTTARQLVLTIAWWWGRRNVPQTNGAYCYLCSRYICVWDVWAQMTDEHRWVLHGHREAHFTAAQLGPLPPLLEESA